MNKTQINKVQQVVKDASEGIQRAQFTRYAGDFKVVMSKYKRVASLIDPLEKEMYVAIFQRNTQLGGSYKALSSRISKRVKGIIEYNTAMKTLNGADEGYEVCADVCVKGIQAELLGLVKDIKAFEKTVKQANVELEKQKGEELDEFINEFEVVIIEDPEELVGVVVEECESDEEKSSESSESNSLCRSVIDLTGSCLGYVGSLLPSFKKEEVVLPV